MLGSNSRQNGSWFVVVGGVKDKVRSAAAGSVQFWQPTSLLQRQPLPPAIRCIEVGKERQSVCLPCNLATLQPRGLPWGPALDLVVERC